MIFFEQYVSNTLAGSGNQSFFVNSDSAKIRKSRTCYKVFCEGEYNYSFLFTNIIDSTFADGSFSYRNKVIDSWKIHEINVGITDFCDEMSVKEPQLWHKVTFDSRRDKTVNPGEFFNTDRIRLSVKEGEYICIEIVFSGEMIPYHEESIIPSFVYEDGEWILSRLHPFPSMIGCDREVAARIAFLGDSITQGVGTEINSYTHWNNIVAENIGTDYAYWNLGLGYGRADDAATDGAWLFKAKQSDIIVVCYGVNDIMREYSEDSIKNNLNTIVDKLKAYGKKVIIQTIPPFDYQNEKITIWNNVNTYIKEELSKKTEFVFDCAEILALDKNRPHMAKYGGHPNAEGCKIWGDRFSKELAKNISNLNII